MLFVLETVCKRMNMLGSKRCTFDSFYDAEELVKRNNDCDNWWSCCSNKSLQLKE